jgi:hypothetical protein
VAKAQVFLHAGAPTHGAQVMTDKKKIKVVGKSARNGV